MFCSVIQIVVKNKRKLIKMYSKMWKLTIEFANVTLLIFSLGVSDDEAVMFSH